MGPGSQRLAERELGWNQQTLRKADLELEHGFACLGEITNRRRKRAETLQCQRQPDQRWGDRELQLQCRRGVGEDGARERGNLLPGGELRGELDRGGADV